jgi:peptidoglycan/LPS O-acetylase OafA/YrhL
MAATIARGPAAGRGAARVSWLDGVRGGAATFVVLHHMWLAAWPGYPRNIGPWWLGWLLYGHLAVAVFIVVSGFSLALAPMRNGGHLKGGVRLFLRRRAWRIVPAYWAAIVVSTVVTVALLGGSALGGATIARGVAVHGLLLQDLVGSWAPNGAFWSIAVEWQIYFLFPLILWLGLRTSLTTAVSCTALLVLVANEAAGLGAPLDKVDHVSPQFLVLFALGVLAAQLGAPGRPRALRRGLGAVALAAFLAFAAIAVARGSEWVVARYFWMDLLFGVGVAAALAVLHAGGAPTARRLLASRAGLRLGLFSYSIYLIHGPVVGVVDRYAVSPLHLAPLATFAALLVAGLPVTLTACYGFHLMFEAPFLRYRDARAFREIPVVRALARRPRAAGEPPVAQELAVSARDAA